MSVRSKLSSVVKVLLVGLVVGGVTVSSASIAQALPADKNSNADSPHEVDTVAVPGTNTVITDAGTESMGITLPGTVTPETVAKPENVPTGLFLGRGEPVLSTRINGAVVSSYATGKGTQTLISVASSSADHEFRFPLSLPAGSQATVETDGSVAVRTAEGEIIGGYRIPWAYDALGRAVATKFSIDGQILVQSIDFDENTAFPVTADPHDFWGWLHCVAIVTAEIANSVNLAGKIARLVTRFGSIQRTFENLFRAWNSASSWDRKMEALTNAGGSLALEIIGVIAIKAACFDS
ncbi:MAG: hypothetical protein B5766_05885 [Candidatus Lumbricidophila eiseniae]|uniref:Uncharacterized protein n=1 Tax=Candidatus Lumbricidiphila eiseniae TaxID=1969409 RepID=A0A2A6FRE5_9MICO|nr:MAG: hypothetical protein B5766_05885 [Candidatus Lumbricidophila eiseniae]